MRPWVQSSVPIKREGKKEDSKAGTQADICILMFTVALFIITKGENNPCPSMYEWINKMLYLHILNVRLKRNEILTHATTWVWSLGWCGC